MVARSGAEVKTQHPGLGGLELCVYVGERLLRRVFLYARGKTLLERCTQTYTRNRKRDRLLGQDLVPSGGV